MLILYHLFKLHEKRLFITTSTFDIAAAIQSLNSIQVTLLYLFYYRNQQFVVVLHYCHYKFHSET